MQTITAKFVDDIKREFFCDDTFICELLKVTPKELEKKYANNFDSFDDILKLADALGVNLEDIQNDTVNYSSIKSRMLRTSNQLPCEYIECAGTYMSNIKSIFNYLVKSTNEKTAKYACNKLGISPENIRHESLMVNIIFLEKLFSILSYDLNMSNDDIRSMVVHSYTSKKRRDLVESISHIGSGIEIAEHITKNSKIYELNFNYSFKKLSDNQCIISTKSNDEINNFMKSGKLISPATIQFKKHSIELLPAFLRQSKLSVKKIKDNTSKVAQTVDFHITCS